MKVQMIDAKNNQVVIEKNIPVVLDRVLINIQINKIWDEFKNHHHAGWMYINGNLHSHSESLRGVK